MKEEIDSIDKNDTWEAVNLPAGRKTIGSKWVFKTKYDSNGSVIRRKARLVAQGFTQKHGIDYDEVFAPVARSESVRLLLSMAGVLDLEVYQYDFKTAFLNGKLEEEIYMRPPPGLEIGGRVLKLKKSLYGLKQAARIWNQAFHESLTLRGFEQNSFDPCVYSFERNGAVIHLVVHVDDLLAITNSGNVLDKLMADIGKDFEIKSLGPAKEFLGMRIEKDSVGNYIISQSNYIDRIVELVGQKNAGISSYPIDIGYFKLDSENFEDNEEFRKVIGMLLYLATKTRPDIAASVGILSQRVSKPRIVDWTEVKRLVRYLNGTKSLGLRLSTKEDCKKFLSFSDADYAEDRVDRKSRTGNCCFVNGGLIAWNSQKQPVVAQSSAEAEYVALSETVKEALWLNRLALSLNTVSEGTFEVRCDNQAAIQMVENPKFSHRTKHIDVRYHLLRDWQSKQYIKLKYEPTETNAADLLTKPLGGVRIRRLRDLIGMVESV